VAFTLAIIAFLPVEGIFQSNPLDQNFKTFVVSGAALQSDTNAFLKIDPSKYVDWIAFD
jgi:hypothetical protein